VSRFYKREDKIMSRSYKKTPYAGDIKGKNKKRAAANKVRTLLKDHDIDLQGSAYRKVFNSYDICDFGEIRTWDDYWLTLCKIHKDLNIDPPNKKIEYRKWLSRYKNK
jgi:hypothetical protein